MPVRLATWTSLLAVLAVLGCGTRRQSDLLEARLRRQESRVIDLENELATARSEISVARREADDYRSRLDSGETGQIALRPEQSETLYRTTGVKIHRLLTGGIDDDGRPGDDLLSLLVIPHDDDGAATKTPGRVEIEVEDPSQDGDARRLGAWSFGVDDSREHWHNGFIGAGFLFKLPWQRPPVGSELVVHVRFTTLDDRRFDAVHTLRVNPPAGSADRFVGEPRRRQPAEPADRIVGEPRRFENVSIDAEGERIDEPVPYPEDDVDSRPVLRIDDYDDGDVERTSLESEAVLELDPADRGGRKEAPRRRGPLYTSDRFKARDVPRYR